jgi:hypothetical protein
MRQRYEHADELKNHIRCLSAGDHEERLRLKSPRFARSAVWCARLESNQRPSA